MSRLMCNYVFNYVFNQKLIFIIYFNEKKSKFEKVIVYNKKIIGRPYHLNSELQSNYFYKYSYELFTHC